MQDEVFELVQSDMRDKADVLFGSETEQMEVVFLVVQQVCRGGMTFPSG